MQARQPDREVQFRQLYEDYADRILSYVYGLVGNRQSAEEIMQEVFLKAYVNLAGFKGRSKLSTWVYSIARNLTYNFLKHQKYEPQASLADEVSIGDGKIELLDTIPDEKLDGPDRKFELKEIEERVQKAISMLSPNYREVIMLCEIHQMPHGEVAKLLKCSVNAVDIRLTRARRELYKVLRPRKRVD
jgi:RNA polymerase sigma-70 factor (ECF subfamily)